jgi:hypothetical protein
LDFQECGKILGKNLGKKVEEKIEVTTVENGTRKERKRVKK